MFKVHLFLREMGFEVMTNSELLELDGFTPILRTLTQSEKIPMLLASLAYPIHRIMKGLLGFF